VVELLTPMKDEQGAASLLFLLEDERNHVESMQRGIDAVLRSLDALFQQEQYAEAIRFLESQPQHVRTTEAAQRAMSGLHAAYENELMELRSIGTAYAALDRMDLRSGVLSSPPEASSFFARIVPVFASRCRLLADKQVSSSLENARTAIESGDRKLAAKFLTEAATFAEFASRQLQSEWQALSKSSEKGGIFKKRSK
jgi:hypothetical protein